MSELVLIEARAGDAEFAERRLQFVAGLPLLPITGEIMELAEELIAEGPIPRKAAGDAAHIAVAAMHGCDYLMTWNCRHIANAELHRPIQRIVARRGYEQVRRVREEYAAQFDYDLKRMFEDLKKKEEQESAPRADLKPLAPRRAR